MKLDKVRRMLTDEILQGAIDIGVGKQGDYGPSNTQFQRVVAMYTEMTGNKLTGVEVADVMIATKLVRLRNLFQSGGEPNNESITDTVIDLIRYAAMRESTRLYEQAQVEMT